MQKMLTISLLFGLLAGCPRPYHPARPQTQAVSASGYQTRTAYQADSISGTETIMPAEPNVLKLGQALALTVMHNPELSAYGLEIRAAQARHLQAGLRPNPELEIEVEEAGGTGDRSGFDAAETTIVLSQLIELGNKRQKRETVAEIEKQLAGLEYRSSKIRIFSEAAKAFIAVLAAQEKLQLADELMALSEQTYETVTKRVSAGRDSPIEQNRAAIARTPVRIAYQQTRRELENARRKLASFWGQDKPHFERAAGNLDSLQPLPLLEEVMEGLKQNPAYTRMQTEIQKNRALLELEKARTIGDVTVGAGLQRFNETDDNAFVFGVSIPLPISDRNQGARQEAALNIRKARREQEAAWLTLQNEISRAYTDFSNAYDQMLALRNEILPAAEQMYQAARRAYEEGQADYLHVLDAQRTLFDAEREYLDSLAACHMSRTDIERLTGNANISMIMSVREE